MIVDPRVARRKFERDVAPIVSDPGLFAEVGVHLVDATFPILRVGIDWTKRATRMHLQMAAPDWDFRPPSVTWTDLGGAVWTGPIPAGNGFQGADARHPAGWLCFPGTLEFHEHTSHVGDVWWARREIDAFRLLGFAQHVAAELRKVA